MEFEEVIQRRGIPAGFLERAVEPAAVERILDCGRRGPSAGFSQGFDFLVLAGPGQTRRYWAATGSDSAPPGIRAAPLLVVPLAHQHAYFDRYAEADKKRRAPDGVGWPVPYWLVDTSFAGALIGLAAVDEGLVSLFFVIDDLGGFRRAFGVPGEYVPIGTIAIGHPGPAGPGGHQQGPAAPQASRDRASGLVARRCATIWS